jgi:hypothetical protein
MKLRIGLTVFEEKELRRIFGTMQEHVTRR